MTMPKPMLIANEHNQRSGKTTDELEPPKIEENVFESRSSRSSSSSGYGLPLDQEVHVEIPKPKTHPMVPKLNLGGKLPLKGEPARVNPIEPMSCVPPQLSKVPNLGLNLENIKKQDFQDEFMEKFDEYSKSWRDMIEQQKRF